MRRVIVITGRLFAQHIDPFNPVLPDKRFLKGLMYSLDRQQLVDTLQFGYGGIADMPWPPGDPDFDLLRISACSGARCAGSVPTSRTSGAELLEMAWGYEPRASEAAQSSLNNAVYPSLQAIAGPTSANTVAAATPIAVFTAPLLNWRFWQRWLALVLAR